jgi:hypothetical protein
MALFRSPLHQEVWIEHHCHRCYFHGQGCTILSKALRTDRKPVEWDRNTRSGALMAETIKCNSETRQPPSLSRPVVNEDVPMFDVESVDGPMDFDHA